MLPLNLMAGMYGMNVSLPFSAHPYAFFYLAAGMGCVLLVMLVFFRIKRWL
jgi:Mg2+ and Co2+ transporter CorA